MTEKDLINLRRTIYLVIMSSVDFEECCHKMLKMSIREEQIPELCTMILECCMQERTYSRFYGLTAQRLTQIAEIYQGNLCKVFVTQFETVHRLEVNKLRNAAKFFAHLLYTDSIEWSCLTAIKLTEDDTTSASRIFIKILMQEIAENLGV
jgi:pre-mRNA-splicing factor CWC22